MADQPSRLLELPLDIFYLIFPYLDVPSFVALTSTCKALQDPELAQFAPYWSSATRSTFRVPNQPVVEHDGLRWQKMYRRLLTDSRCYTWGNNDRSCLGHGDQSHFPIRHRRPGNVFREQNPAVHVSWPTKVDTSASAPLGIIADMQCGGWTTNLLTSKGGLYSIGVMNGLGQQAAKPSPQQLRYPPGFPHPHERYDAVTAISQFSAGRSHVLGLSDGGNIWAWGNIGLAALQIKFLGIDLASNEKVSSSTPGFVRKVVAGWSLSTALVVGKGIIVWDPVTREAREGEEDTMLIMEPVVVPGTGFQRKCKSSKSSSDSDIGEVQNFICLEHYIIFVTHLGKVYAAQINWSRESKDVSDVREICIPADEQANDQTASADSQFVTDVQGSFRSFAIFTRSGAVLTGNQDHLATLFSPENIITPLDHIPALQQAQVISIAFGDYHFHALHAPGYITSYGSEPQGCGCLGLGGHGNPEGRLRGVRYQGLGGDGSLVPHANLHGRRVWFEKEKQRWITFLASGGNDPEEAKERMQMCSNPTVQGEVSEWVEQEGNAWEERYGGSGAADTGDGLGSYFALSVTAAGWHSGALVLVNEDMATKVREGCVEQPKEPLEDEAADKEESKQEEAGTLINRTLDYAGSLVERAFSLLSTGTDTTAGPSFRDPNDPNAFVNPQNHGALNEDGNPFMWSRDAFPRLRLANGDEMPGTVDFCEWRNGRPQWEGNVAGY